jgi:hypothetical protein
MSSFMSPAGGGGDPIQEAMARRNMPAPQQISPGNPNYQPSMQPSPLPPGGGPPPTQPGQPQPQQTPMPQGVPQQGTSESRVIVGALKSRLELLGKMGQ